jgi:hypothetical protein
METVTAERIEAVRADIETVNRVSKSSTLSQNGQDKRLQQCCRAACSLLKDWLESDWWDQIDLSDDEPISNFVPHRRHFKKFLGPELKSVLARASGPGMPAPDKLVDQARRAVKATKSTAHRYPEMTPQQLFQAANTSIAVLAEDVCELAKQLHDRNATSEQRAAVRQKACKVLKRVGALTGTLLIAMAGVAPGDALNHLNEWDRQIIKVLVIHDIAEKASLPGRGAEPVGPVPGRVSRAAHSEPTRPPTSPSVDEHENRRPGVRHPPQSVGPPAPPLVRSRRKKPAEGPADERPPRPGRSERGGR